MRAAALACLFSVLTATTVRAQPSNAPPSDERLVIDATFVAVYGHDGAQSALGFDKQGRVGQATLTLSGRLHEKFRYRLAFNPVDETSSRPACGEADFFFPNDPRFYTAGPTVVCDPENGHKRVDTYNTFAVDYIVQQGPLREGFIDWLVNETTTARFGRFILPIGFSPEEAASWSAKDMTRIQRLNAEANFGLMLGYARKRFDVSAMAVLGDGNREKDYDWFYFANPTLDSNSALTAAITARVRPHSTLDLRVSAKKGYTGSKVERLPSYWASKRNDNAVVVSGRFEPHPVVAVFGEYARYTWGPAETSANFLGVDSAPIHKPGYYVGTTVSYPITPRVVVGTTVTREEISRDDSLVKYLAANGLYGVEMGRKDRGTTTRVFVIVSQAVTAGVYRANVSNPYPWVSGSWPVSGARAFTGRAPDRYGLMVSFRGRLFP
jgi:hypothetical protein